MSDRLNLVVGADRHDLPVVDAALRAFAQSHGASPSDVERVSSVAGELCDWTLTHAFPDGRRGSLALDVEVTEEGLSLLLSDDGQPMSGFGVETGGVPAELAAVAAATKNLRLATLGAAGKRLNLVIPIPGLERSPEEDSSGSLSDFGRSVAITDDVTVRDATPADAEGIARLLYRTYGWGYGHDSAYDPAWLAERLESGEIVSAVGLLGDEIVSHHALLIEPGTSCAESALAATDPTLRGVGVAGLLAVHAETQAAKLGIPATISRGATTHPYSQKATHTFGFRETALLLACVPHSDGVTRVPLLASFRCTPGEARRVSLPSRYAEQLQAAYDNLNVQRGEPDVARARGDLRGDAPVWVSPESITHIPGTETITVSAWGPEVAQLLSDHLRRAVRRDNHVVYVDLDLHTLSGSELDEIVEFLRNYFFSFAGLMVYGPNAHDFLRMQALLTDEAQIDGVVLASPFAQALGEFVFADISLRPKQTPTS